MPFLTPKRIKSLVTVRDFYQIQHAHGKIFDEKNILKELAPSLRSEILLYNCRHLYSIVPVLKSSPMTFTSGLAAELSSQIAFAKEDVIIEKTTGSTLYFIFSGICEVRPKATGNRPFVALADGCYFGCCGALLGCKRTATVRTKTLCEMYSIQGTDLMASLTDYPEVLSYMEMVAAKRKNRLDVISKGSVIDEGNTVDLEDSKTDLFSKSLEHSLSNGGRTNMMAERSRMRGSGGVANSNYAKARHTRRTSRIMGDSPPKSGGGRRMSIGVPMPMPAAKYAPK